MELERCVISGGYSSVPSRFSHVPRTRFPATARPWCSTIRSESVRTCSETDRLDRHQSRKRMFILGMGFVGQVFAQQLKNQGWVVSGTTKSAAKKNELEEKGLDVYHFNASEPDLIMLNTLKDYSHLLVSIPPVVGLGDPMLQHGELLRSTLMNGHLRWLGYLSSTGVYGHCDGAWVDEDYPANPTTELAKLRLAAEEGWLNLGHDLGLSAQVFRLGGIYGSGRSAVDTIIKQGSLSEGQKLRGSRQYTSRIHVDDICQVLEASIQKPSSRTIYNVVDDNPAPRAEVFAYALELVEKKWPGRLKESVSVEEVEPFNKKEGSRGEKRVCNVRMKKELGVRLLHSSYKSGLRSIIHQMENPFRNSLLE